MVAEQNNDSDVTDLKLDLDGDIFPSIITVSPISKKILFLKKILE